MVRNVVDILTAIIALAVVATLVRNPGTSKVISSSASGFAKVLRAAQGR